MDGYVRGTLYPDTSYIYSYTQNPNKAWKWATEEGLRANSTFTENPDHEVVSFTEEELDMFLLHEE